MNRLLAVTRNVIPYVKELRQLDRVKSASCAILMQQMEYWFDRAGDGFYKFLNPCEHQAYREGDSWTEELAFSPQEWRTAFNSIGIKYKDKTSFDKESDPFQGRYYCAYTNKRDGLTYYFRNHALVDAELETIGTSPKPKTKVLISGDRETGSREIQNLDLQEIQKLDLPRSRNLISHLYTEITPEITPEPTHAQTRAREKEKIENKDTKPATGSKEKPNPKKHKHHHSLANNQDSGESNFSAKFEEKIKAFRRDLLEFATQNDSIRSPSGWVSTILEEVTQSEGDSPWWKEWLDGEAIGSHRMNEWHDAPDKVNSEFLKYLKLELAQPNDSEAHKLERAHNILQNPDRARGHWNDYQRKQQSQKEREEQKAEEELKKMDELFPEDAPYYFVETLTNEKGFDKNFTLLGGGILKRGILRAYSYASQEEKEAIAQLLVNNETTKEWAARTL